MAVELGLNFGIDSFWQKMYHSFPMKDRTRHSLAVLLFLVFGPTCTVALVGWIALRRSPLAVQYETSVLQAATGVDLKTDSVEYLRWNLWRYGQVELPHPNTGQPFVAFSDLENRLVQPKISRSGTIFSPLLPKARQESVRQVHSPFVSIALNSEADIAILGNLLLNQFGDRFAGRQPNLAFHFEEVEIRCQGLHYNLSFVDGSFRSEGGKSSLKCTFKFQENPLQEPISFTITRQEPELIVELKTDATEVPVRFLALLFPGLKSLGAEAFFHGTVRGERSQRGSWIVTFENMTIEKADLKTLGAGLTPYRLGGQVLLSIRTARVELSGTQSRFLDAAGWIQVENGTMERKLLAQLVEDWQLSPTPNNVTNPLHRNDLDFLERYSQGKDVDFALARFVIFLGRDGISLRPIQAEQESGLVMKIDPQNFYKYHLPEQISKTPIPYLTFFHTFSPPDAELVPLTPQIQRIVPSLFLLP